MILEITLQVSCNQNKTVDFSLKYNVSNAGWAPLYDIRSVDVSSPIELTYKAKRIVTLVYKKLNGEEIAETAHANPLFRNDASYMDKVYRNSIVDMNDFIKQQRHLFQE